MPTAYVVSWPTTLPATPFGEEGATYTPMENNIIRSSNEYGPGKLRRRFTGQNEKLTFTMVLSPSQLATFKTFYNVTVSGVKRFKWKDHRTGAVAFYRFMKEPAQGYAGSNADGSWWAMNVELELVP
jgi:hypothetical protein